MPCARTTAPERSRTGRPTKPTRPRGKTITCPVQVLASSDYLNEGRGRAAARNLAPDLRARCQRNDPRTRGTSLRRRTGPQHSRRCSPSSRRDPGTAPATGSEALAGSRQGKQTVEGHAGLGIGDAIDAGRPIVPLERAHHDLGLRIVDPSRCDAIAVCGQRLLQLRDVRTE